MSRPFQKHSKIFLSSWVTTPGSFSKLSFSEDAAKENYPQPPKKQRKKQTNKKTQLQNMSNYKIHECIKYVKSMNTVCITCIFGIFRIIRIFRISLLVIEEWMITQHSLHCATTRSSGCLELKGVRSRVNVQSLHVIVNFPQVQHTGTFVWFFA